MLHVWKTKILSPQRLQADPVKQKQKRYIIKYSHHDHVQNNLLIIMQKMTDVYAQNTNIIEYNSLVLCYFFSFSTLYFIPE